MARRVKKEFKVGLNKPDAAALKELVRRERVIRQLPAKELGGATLLREFAIPLVHARLAELRMLDAGAEGERRLGEPDRRHEPAGATS